VPVHSAALFCWCRVWDPCGSLAIIQSPPEQGDLAGLLARVFYRSRCVFDQNHLCPRVRAGPPARGGGTFAAPGRVQSFLSKRKRLQGCPTGLRPAGASLLPATLEALSFREGDCKNTNGPSRRSSRVSFRKPEHSKPEYRFHHRVG
jgi:hypothetical protein